MGRKAKPRHLKVIAGTLRPGRDNPDAPVALPGELLPPSWMTEEPGPKTKKRERELKREHLAGFRRIAAALEAIGCASPTFLDAVVVAARALAVERVLAAELAEAGFVVEKDDINGEPMLRAHPAATLWLQAVSQSKSLLAELGLTPTSLARASKAGGSRKPGNGFRELG